MQKREQQEQEQQEQGQQEQGQQDQEQDQQERTPPESTKLKREHVTCKQVSPSCTVLMKRLSDTT